MARFSARMLASTSAMRYVYIHKRARAHTPLLGASAHAFEHHTNFWMCELTRSALHMCALRVAWIHTHTHTHTHILPQAEEEAAKKAAAGEAAAASAAAAEAAAKKVCSTHACACA